MTSERLTAISVQFQRGTAESNCVFGCFALNGTNVVLMVNESNRPCHGMLRKQGFSAEAAPPTDDVSCGTTGKDSFPVERRSNGSFTEVAVTLSTESPHVNRVGVCLWLRKSSQPLQSPLSQLDSPG